MSYHYGFQKFELALKDLVEAGDIRSRVRAAVCQHLLHLDESTDIPDSMKEEFSTFRQELNPAGAGGQHVADLLEEKSEQEAQHVAQSIVDMFIKMNQR
mgnify:CR=1 FL=1